MLTRRWFIQRAGLAATAATAAPSFFARAAQAAMAGQNAVGYGDDTILVVVQMSGGNDGLNTVVPYGLDGYRQARPNLGVKESDVLPLTDTVGLHPQMEKIRDLYQAGHVAIVQGAGYPNPNLSHFRAMEIWQTAVPENYDPSGWLADYLASTNADDNNPMYAASVTDGLSRALYGNGSAPCRR
ncbi:MAG: twin-arginine translocation pathway signal [Chloroflexi bacterium]|nr:twin-arginine translocation pathway signal [Chloroflexota bacterium]